jgi:hypothetical protein
LKHAGISVNKHGIQGKRMTRFLNALAPQQANSDSQGGLKAFSGFCLLFTADIFKSPVQPH